ncbi:MAG: glycosyltransferase, partial [Planctomycetota bacterium]
LAGGVGFIVAAFVAFVAVAAQEYDVAIAALAFAGALAGFLYFNGPWGTSGRVFMGDGGSMFLGVAVASLPLVLNSREGVGTMRAVVVPAAAMGVPILDAGLTLIRRRVLQRRSLFAAEDGHVHHRLLAIGLSQKHAVFVIWGVSFLAGAIALVAAHFGDGWATLSILFPLLALLFLFLFRTAGSVRGRETISMIRRHRAAGRRGKGYRKAFEEAQLRLAKAADFGEWWRETCHAAELLDFASLKLSSSKRDGSPYEIAWTNESETLDERLIDATTVSVSLEVPQRRLGDGSPLSLCVEVYVHPSNSPLDLEPETRPVADLELAGHRITYFNRLLTEHGLATLDNEDRARLAKAHKRRLASSPSADGGASTNGQSEARDGAPSVAIVHDFLYTRGGAERVLEQMLQVFPHADLFSVIDFVPENERSWMRDKRATTTFIQRLPLAKYKHRAYLPLMPMAIEQLDVSGYDVVLSSSYCVAKGVICRPDQLHVSYCHSPVRYAWDMQHQYLAESGLAYAGRRRGPIKLLKNAVARSVLHYIRQWDFRSAAGVDVFLSNSDFVGRRIEKAYRRPSTTVYPPVDISAFKSHADKQDYYFTSSRMVPYKRMPLIAEAFTQTPERRLVIGGDGPDMEKVKAVAGPNVRVVGHQKHEELVHYMQRAKAFVFAAEEDFGIVPVEAMACGTPVITYGRGGATETVIDGVTGVHFDRQTPDSLLEAVERFELLDNEGRFNAEAITRHAQQFGEKRFREELNDLVLSHWKTRTGAVEEAGVEEGEMADVKDDAPEEGRVPERPL